MTYRIVTEAANFNSGPKRLTTIVDATAEWAAVEAACIRHRHSVTPSSCPGIRVISCEVKP
jgi:hypothetical protein